MSSVITLPRVLPEFYKYEQELEFGVYRMFAIYGQSLEQCRPDKGGSMHYNYSEAIYF